MTNSSWLACFVDVMRGIARLSFGALSFGHFLSTILRHYVFTFVLSSDSRLMVAAFAALSFRASKFRFFVT